MENINHFTVLERFFLMLKDYRKEVSLTYQYAIFGGLVNLILPIGIQATLNLVQSGALTSSWWLLVLTVTAGTIFNGALVIMQASLNETLQKRIFTDISFDFATRIPQFDLEQTRRDYLPEVVNRFFETIPLTKNIPKILSDLTAALLQIVFGLLLLSFYHPYFIIFGLLLSLVLFIILRFTSPSGLRTSLQESKYKYEVVFWLEELSRTVSTFKHAANSNYHIKRVDKLVSKYLESKTAHFKILTIQYWSLVGFKTLITFLLLALGGYLVVQNQINLGQFVASEIIIILIINASEKIILLMDIIFDVLTSIDKIGHVMDIPIEKNAKMVSTFEKGMAITLNTVSFNFFDVKKNTLTDINLEIQPLERVCIAGYDASGRSTLLQIIASFLKPKQGTVLFNHIPSANYNLELLRSEIGYYASSEQIFRGTLKENITLGFEEITNETIVRLLQSVGLNQLLAELEGGLEAMLLPDGKNLSRSIVSKILIARSLAHDPKLLVMENLLNSLQWDEKMKIIDVVTSKNRTWTFVCASDDPDVAAHCDTVIILDRGKIVTTGTFERIKNSEHFAKVFKGFNSLTIKTKTDV